MSQKLASIDIGSYTARMLIAFKESRSDKIIPISRMREYISIADYFEATGVINEDAAKIVAKVLNGFVSHAHQRGVDSIIAVGTGVIRRAKNRNEFISKIEKATDIRIAPILGEQEARLTAEGAIHSLGIENKKNFVIVDIGGGSTEFFIRRKDADLAFSIPIGAAILQNQYISSDPPREVDLDKVHHDVLAMLKGDLRICKGLDFIVGTGGTITALAALIHRIPLQEISPERINGKILKYVQIKDVLEEIKDMDLNQRADIMDLDKKRAKVIIPGIIILLGIMDLFSLRRITVSLSDLLEGILLIPLILQEEM